MGLTGRRSPKWILILTLLLVTTFIFTLNVSGYFSLRVATESDYQTEFSYPLNVDLLPLIDNLKHGENPSIGPLYQQYNVSFILPNSKKCNPKDKSVKIQLLIMVKTDAGHFYQRNAIRISWGQEDNIPGVRIKRVFLIGTRPWIPDLQQQLETEQSLYSDLVQASFFDTYYNSTYKIMSGFKWATQYCPDTEYVLFVDDDMYVSVRNVLQFLRNPSKYPEYPETIESTGTYYINPLNTSTFEVWAAGIYDRNQATVIPFSGHSNLHLAKRSTHEKGSATINERLYAGFVFPSAKPHRSKLSKWYISTSEYPYDRWPPYVTGGAIVFSRSALVDMYHASFYTQPFRFDDIYVAILAKKTGIRPYHCNEFYFSKKDYVAPQDYKHVIISHGYNDFQELLHVWGQQRRAGYA